MLNQLIRLLVEQPFLDRMLNSALMVMELLVDDGSDDEHDDAEVYQSHL